VLRKIGRAEYATSPITAVQKPMPSHSASRTISPIDGMAWPKLPSPRPIGLIHRAKGRVSRTPRGTAIAIVRAVATSESCTCSQSSSLIFAGLSERLSIESSVWVCTHR